MKPLDIENTAFNAKYGQFEYSVMPMGLRNATATLKLLMNRIFYDFIDDFLVVYKDDLRIFNKSETEHLEDLNGILSRLS